MKYAVTITLCFLIFKVSAQLNVYNTSDMSFSKIKKIKPSSLSTSGRVKINSNGYTLYLDKADFTPLLDLHTEFKKELSSDTIDLSPYYAKPNLVAPILKYLYEMALKGKMRVYNPDGSLFTGNVFKAKFSEGKKTGCTLAGTCIYIKSPSAILITGQLSLYKNTIQLN